MSSRLYALPKIVSKGSYRNSLKIDGPFQFCCGWVDFLFSMHREHLDDGGEVDSHWFHRMSYWQERLKNSLDK